MNLDIGGLDPKAAELITKLTFEERLKNRVKESIGELLTDDDLKQIIETTAHEMIFADEKDRYGNVKREPSIKLIVRDLLKDRMDGAIDRWLEKHAAEVKEAIGEVLNREAGTILLEAFNAKLRNDLDTFRFNVETRMIGRP